MKEYPTNLKRHLQLICLNQVLAAGFNLYFFFTAIIDCWTSLALFFYDGATRINNATECSRYLCRMTRWNRPFLTRHKIKMRHCKRTRKRSPMIYSSRHGHTKIWRKARRPHALIFAFCATSLQVFASLPQGSRPKSLMRFDTDSVPIGIDNCATFCLSDHKGDFVGPLKRVNCQVNGIGGHQAAKWTGTVKWPVVDDTGKRHELLIPNTILVPKGSIPFRLLSPQHFGQENFKQGIDTHDKGTLNLTSGVDNWLSWGDLKFSMTTQLTNGSNIALINTDSGYSRFSAFVDLVEPADEPPDLFRPHLIPDDDEPYSERAGRTLRFADEINTANEGAPSTDEGAPSTAEGFPSPTNATNNQPHVVDFLQGEICLPTVEEAEDNESKLDNPTHELLLYHYRLAHEPFKNLQHMAQQGILPKRLANCRVPQCAACHYGKASKVPWRVKGDPKDGNLFQATVAGQVVSVDQLKSTVPGLVGQIKGWLTTQRYHVATIFVDHYSRLSFVHLQKSDTAEETLMAKHAFEGYARTMGVKVLHYHADNGRFCENVFMKDVTEQGQTISFCGVNAHFQSGVAERRIRELQDGARTSLIHAKHRWGSAIDSQLWPYALRHRNDVFNSTQKQGRKLSPLETFSNSKIRPKLKHFHPFGCPVYRVNNEIQAGNNHPKWLSRAKPVVYLGSSPRHARSVSLVLDLETAHVSPQFHLRYDNLFETVSPGRINPQAQLSNWQKLCGFRGSKPRSTAPTRTEVTIPVGVEQPDQAGDTAVHDEPPADISGIEPEPPDIAPDLTDDAVGPFGNPLDAPVPVEPITTRRSGRNRTLTQRFVESLQQRDEGLVAFVAAYEAIDPMLYQEDRVLQVFETDPIAFALKATSNPDTMYYHEAMKESDAPQFRIAMKKEVDDHTAKKHWKIIRRDQVPEGVKVLPAVWAMKRKRRIATREVYKWKARLNIGGHMQQYGVHYWETYSPVVRWTTIRLCLVLAMVNGWSTRQLDFVQAYPQAKISTDQVYIDVPQGVEFKARRQDFCLHVLQNIYGGKDAGRAWSLHLDAGLKELGFTRSDVDNCLYYRGHTIFLVYVDDGILIDPDPKKIDQAMADLASKFEIEDEGEIDDYLGVKIEKGTEAGTLLLSQPHLIDSILEDLRLLNHGQTASKTADTPAAFENKLHKDLNGKPFDYPWEYRSVIGKLNFLEKSTRGDLAYSVHQCARFMAQPMKSHGEAVKRIGRYLLSTRGKGVILRPDRTKSFDCYVDADYCGNWNPFTTEDPSTAKSRTGYIITYLGCPLVWASRLQTVYALSTAEAEYIALSTALRDVIPMMDLLTEMKERGFDVQSKPTVHCKLFEDNSGALEQARVAKYRPRTRHINAAWHHFRSYVVDKLISIHAIDTKSQLGDVFTKQVSLDDFVRFRKLIFGW
jgi:Reverse transcriptase (RNA-dependent DNA polymerase)